MNIWSISIQNIKSKPLYSILSVFILSLSIALLLGIQQIKISFKNQIENNLSNIDLVVGAKGSPLQLVLASILHLDSPTGNISYKDAKKIANSPMVKSAIPISYGDNYKGFRIVGTTEEYVLLFGAEYKSGRSVTKTMEVVLGSTVAEQLGLSIGDTLLSSHGLMENSIEVHSDKLTVVGILKPTSKVIDRLIITNLESVWDVHDHHDGEHQEVENHLEQHHQEENHKEEQEHHKNIEKVTHTAHNHHYGEEDEEDKEITSLLVNFKSPRALLTFPRKINKDTNMQAALPKYEFNKLYEYTSIGFQTISWIAYLILVISCVIIFVSIYKMVKERAYDLALLRTFGATNFQLVKMVFYEGLLISIAAFLFGFVLIKVGLRIMLHYMQANYKQNILQELPLQDVLQLGGLIFTMVVLSVCLAIYPLIKMNISTILSNEK